MPKMPLPSEYNGLPVVGVEKMRELDRMATAEYGIASETLMENAGRAVAKEILNVCVPSLTPSPSSPAKLVPVFCCGRGNNGGDGLVAARILKDAGANPEVFLMAPKKGRDFGGLVLANIERAREKGIKISLVTDDLQPLEKSLSSCNVCVDALLGTGSVGKPGGMLKKVIQLMNKSGKPVAAVDIPSGISPDTGYHSGVFIKAKWTFTLGMPKTGLMAPHAIVNVGELKVLDIGYPSDLVRRVK